MTRTITLGLAATIAAAASAAPVSPFVETFESGNAAWADVASAPATWTPTGALDGSAYISGSIADVYTLNPTFGGIVLRAQDAFDSSNDAFVGDYIAGGITTVSIDIRHNGGDDMGFFIRLAGPLNSPAAVFFSPSSVASGQWTTLTFDIDENSPFYVQAGAPSPTFFQDVVGNVANLQVGVLPGAGYTGNAGVTFDLDSVRLIPAPGALALLGLGGLAAVRRKR